MVKEIILKTDLGLVERDLTEEEMQEELKQVLFEICEDWVINGQEPDFEFN